MLMFYESGLLRFLMNDSTVGIETIISGYKIFASEHMIKKIF